MPLSTQYAFPSLPFPLIANYAPRLSPFVPTPQISPEINATSDTVLPLLSVKTKQLEVIFSMVEKLEVSEQLFLLGPLPQRMLKSGCHTDVCARCK